MIRTLILSGVVLWIATEAMEVKRLAPKYSAEIEARQWDGSRVDLLSDQYAIEVDYAAKWPEGVGQSLYYSIQTGRPPALLLLTNGSDDDRYVYRAQAVCAKHGIRLFVEPIK